MQNGGGSSLLRQPWHLAEIVKAVREAVAIPVTVKIRSGWDANSINAEEIALMVQDLGVDAITLHPRTQTQGFSGQADWGLIKRVKKLIKIPLIGNGDIHTPEDSWRMLTSTGCDAVMVGRGALGNPWIFREILHFLSTGRKFLPPSVDEKISIIRYHFDLLVKNYGVKAIPRFRKHAGWYLRAFPRAAELREKINRLNSRQDLELLLEAYQALASVRSPIKPRP